MRPCRVVILLPHTDDALRMGARVKLVDTGTFVPQPTVEGFNEPVSPGLPGGINTKPTSIAPPRRACQMNTGEWTLVCGPWSVTRRECCGYTVIDDEDTTLVDEFSAVIK